MGGGDVGGGGERGGVCFSGRAGRREDPLTSEAAAPAGGGSNRMADEAKDELRPLEKRGSGSLSVGDCGYGCWVLETAGG